MTSNRVGQESWRLESILCILIGVPWYFFSSSVWASLAIHVCLALAYLAIEVRMFGRGSAITSFLLVFVFAVLAGIVLVGLSGGRLFR